MNVNVADKSCEFNGFEEKIGWKKCYVLYGNDYFYMRLKTVRGLLQSAEKFAWCVFGIW